MDYITRIMANARLHLTGVIDDAVKIGLFTIVDEFCKETNIWQEEIPVVVIAGENIVYDLIPTKGTPLRLMDLYTTVDKITYTGAMQIPGELVLSNSVNVGTQLLALISLAPIDPVEVVNEFPDIPSWIWARYNTLFVDGIIATMAAHPDKPYTNGTLVQYHGKRWRNGISVARADGTKQNMADGQAWRFPRFA